MPAEVGGGNERLAIKRNGPIRVAHDHGRVEDDEAVPLVKPGDCRAHLFRPFHAFESDGPQMPVLRHGLLLRLDSASARTPLFHASSMSGLVGGGGESQSSDS